MNIRSAVTGALLAAFASTASAQEMWHGFYVGVNAGYGFGKSDVSTTTVFSPTGYFAQSSVDTINKYGVGSLSPSGFIGGATAGLNISHGKTLFGLEGDFDAFSASDSRSVTGDYICCVGNSFTLSQKVQTNWLATLRLRLGVATPDMLWYITGGGAFVSIKMSETFTDTYGPSDQSGVSTATRTGWTAGIGGEKALGADRKWSLKFEYLYADLGKMTFTGGILSEDGTPQPDNPFSNSATLTVNVVRLGLNYHFK
jgi:outer membrane immunogenic protein